jgi:hypothetical protein
MSTNFDFITDSYEKLMLKTAYDSITSLELWNYMKTTNKSFMLCLDMELNLIMNENEKLGYAGHSGFSFAWTMREMQYIAQHSLSQYIELRMKEQEEEQKKEQEEQEEEEQEEEEQEEEQGHAILSF